MRERFESSEEGAGVQKLVKEVGEAVMLKVRSPFALSIHYKQNI